MAKNESGGWRENKWIRGAIPALLLHCSIGTVYCWSIFSEEIAKYIGFSKGATEWAFSFAIFFLGMSAAFLGNVVERDIHKSSLIATICFALGMFGTGYFIMYGGANPHSLVALIGIYVCYGFIMGIGLGTGYLSPVKTLMLWFKDRKGLATGLAVAGFGAAKAIASPIMESMLKSLSGQVQMGEEAFLKLDETARAGLSVTGGLVFNQDGTPYMVSDGTGLYKMFMILAAVYFVVMFIGHLLLKKPADWHEPQGGEAKPGIMEVLKTRPLGNYVGIWVMFYINITCGLALIRQEKMIFKCLGFAAMVGVLSTISAVFNAGGRLGFSAWADSMKDRNTIYKLIFILSIVFTGLVIVTGGIKNGYGNMALAVLTLALVYVVNAGYGGGFSNVPTLLSDHYGMSAISAIHGITLSAWAFAGLTGNQMANYIVNTVCKSSETTIMGSDGHEIVVNPVGYQSVLYVTCALYVIALLMSLFLVRSPEKDGGKK